MARLDHHLTDVPHLVLARLTVPHSVALTLPALLNVCQTAEGGGRPDGTRALPPELPLKLFERVQQPRDVQRLVAVRSGETRAGGREL